MREGFNMNLEVLISTMNIGSQNENEKLVKDMNITGKSLTISQCGKNGDVKGKNRIIYDNKKGLSRSRNKMVILLGLTRSIGVVLCRKKDVV